MSRDKRFSTNYGICDQQSPRLACAYAQSEYYMNIKLLTEHHMVFLSLRGGCTGSSQSTHCWKSHVTAQIIFLCLVCLFSTLGLNRSEFPLSTVSCFSRPVSGRLLVDKSKNYNIPFSLVIVCLIFITSQPA